MIIKKLSAGRRSAVGIGIVAPSNDTRIRNIRGEEITKPVNADVLHRPSLLTVSIESVDCHDTRIPS